MILEQWQLGGLSRERAELMGKPHLGACYQGSSHKLAYGALCVVCGSIANNAHHVVHRKTCKTWTLNTAKGMYRLHSPLFAVCGSGTLGCHHNFHGGARYEVEWVWRNEWFEREWWSGETLTKLSPHDRRLFRQGYYVLKDKLLGIERKLEG